jgi:hypothetical protein
VATFGATVAAEDCGGVPTLTDSSPPTAGPWIFVATEELPPDRFVFFGQLIAWAVLANRPCFCALHATHSPAASTSFLHSSIVEITSNNFLRFFHYVSSRLRNSSGPRTGA